MAKVIHILALLTHFYLIFKNVSTKVENMTFQFARGEKYILLNLVIFAETTFISHACEQIQDLWTYVLLWMTVSVMTRSTCGFFLGALEAENEWFIWFCNTLFAHFEGYVWLKLQLLLQFGIKYHLFTFSAFRQVLNLPVKSLLLIWFDF